MSNFKELIIDEVLSDAKKIVAILLKNNIINNKNGFDIHIGVNQGGLTKLNVTPNPIKIK